VGDDQVIEEVEADGLAGAVHAVFEEEVLDGRGGVAARLEAEDDDAGGGEAEGLGEDGAGLEGDAVEGADVEGGGGEGTALEVEVEGAQDVLVGAGVLEEEVGDDASGRVEGRGLDVQLAGGEAAGEFAGGEEGGAGAGWDALEQEVGRAEGDDVAEAAVTEEADGALAAAVVAGAEEEGEEILRGEGVAADGEDPVGRSRGVGEREAGEVGPAEAAVDEAARGGMGGSSARRSPAAASARLAPLFSPRCPLASLGTKGAGAVPVVGGNDFL
jgi:hypothetical protein